MKTYGRDEIRQALREAKALRADYAYVAVRVQTGTVSVGDILAPSHVWVDGDPTDETLPGTCAFCSAPTDGTKYMGDCLIVVGGDIAEYGEDDGEIIIEDAEVLAVL